MRRWSFLVACLFCSIAVSAQTAPASASPPPPDQCRIAFYTRDSIAIQFADAKPKYESIAKSHDKLRTIREKQIPAMDRVLTTNSEGAISEVAALKKDSVAEEQNIAKQYQLLQPTYKKIDAIADSIGKARGVKQTRESADNSAMICPPDQMLMIDITNDIAIAMHVKPKLAIIGVYNSDSLMRLMPGYAVLADSTQMEMALLDIELAIMQLDIDIKQLELDSLRPDLSRKQITKREEEIAKLQDEFDTYRGWQLYKIDTRDAQRTQKYRDRFQRALATASKQHGCYRVYETPDAHKEWTVSEAEFIDLNADIAQLLTDTSGK